MDVILLRKLTEKSLLKFGKYKDLTVMELLNIRKHPYIRWVYYNMSNITFTDEVLQKINIFDRDKIKKPGVNPEMFELKQKANAFIGILRYGYKYGSHGRRVNKARLVSFGISDRFIHKKCTLQAINHGKI